MENFLRGKFQIKSIVFDELPMNVKIWSYVMVMSPILCIPTYAIYKLLITPGKTFDEVK
jgi:hypothetical protein